MHNWKHKRMLKKMSTQEKLNRVSMKALRARGVLLSEFNHRYVSINEMPHKNRGQKQFVIWLKKDGDNISPEERAELLDIKHRY